MDNFMSGAEVQEVAEPVMMEDTQTVGTEEETLNQPMAEAEAEGAEEQEVAEPAAEAEREREDKLTADQSFAQMRRNEAEARRQAQEAAVRMQKMEESQRRLLGVLGNLGFHGTDVDEVTDRAVAHYTGKSVDEVRNARLQQEQEQQRVQQQMELTQRLQAQNREMAMQLVKTRMAEDLAKIQKINPKVKDLNELGPGFGQLIRQGIPAERAYRVLAEEKKEAELTPPAKIGKVNAKTKAEKDFYTSEEVDKLTAAELDDPKVRAKVMRSMTKW